jgi:subtilisin family serine protease
VAATVSSNAFAAAGVTSKTTLIGVKVCNVNGSCPTSAVLAGIMYAADQGAHIINLSVGGLFLKSANPGFVSVIQRAINDAHRRGTILVTSAGNAAADLDRSIVPLPLDPSVPIPQRTPTHLPSLFASYCDGATVVCVSATGPTSRASINGPWTNIDSPASYTNFGRSAIDVAAPGGNGASSVTAACSRFSLQIPICQTGTFVLGINGTSMASPHAAGVAALLVANGARNPAQIRSRLHQTADDLGERGTDPYYGKGRINAARAVGVNEPDLVHVNEGAPRPAGRGAVR